MALLMPTLNDERSDVQEALANLVGEIDAKREKDNE
jgi:hypothetical protein